MRIKRRATINILKRSAFYFWSSEY